MVRFQADADLNQIIVAALVRRARGVDFRQSSSSRSTCRRPSPWMSSR